MSEPEAPQASFDVMLRPHRSLSVPGFWLLMLVISGICFAAGIVFTMLGAWPVFGFLGLDVLAIYLAFRLSYRQARLCETVRLLPDSLEVRRVHPDGRVEEWLLPPNWLSVEVEARANSARGTVRLRSHGREVRIGGFLSPPQRHELAAALSEALTLWRQAPHLRGA